MNIDEYRWNCIFLEENVWETNEYWWITYINISYIYIISMTGYKFAPRGFPPAVWPASGKKSPAEALDAMRKGGPVTCEADSQSTGHAQKPTMESHTKLTNISANKSFDKSTNHQKHQEIPRNTKKLSKTGSHGQARCHHDGGFACFVWPRGGLGMFVESFFPFTLRCRKSID